MNNTYQSSVTPKTVMFTNQAVAIPIIEQRITIVLAVSGDISPVTSGLFSLFELLKERSYFPSL